MPNVTAEQVKDLYYEGHVTEIDRGDGFSPVTIDDVTALMQSSGITPDDTDEDGNPAEHMWEVLAESLNTNELGRPTSDRQSFALQEVAEARFALDEAERQIAALKEQLDVDAREERLREAIRAALSTKAPRQAIADEARLSIPRLYQIRDGRR
ncbi:hypothetical protein [Streptomyces sp. NPDC046821]|uniref:hypothetical protein n=1 Tax=Streptomyces sp. NPDC046821 TaxID=3154702 RepID=UPI0033CC7356